MSICGCAGTDILEAFTHDHLIDAASFGMLATNLLKYPLIILPLRSIINSFFNLDVSATGRMFETLILVAAAYGVAVACGNIAVAFQVRNRLSNKYSRSFS